MKKLDIKTLLHHLSIHFTTDGSKHNMPGWVNVHCPFCTGPKDYHLGFHEQQEYANCWRCGWHPLDASIAALTNVNIFEAKRIIKQHRTGRPIRLEDVNRPPIQRPNKVKVPGGDLEKVHLNYLKKRGFDAESIEWLVNTFDIKGTGPIGPDSHRIIAPIYFDKNLVSYQGRDYTEQSLLKYKACPKVNEIREHQHCLYGMDLASNYSFVVVVEGVVDVWKLGPGAVGTFGSEFTWPQVKLLSQRWPRQIILYDKDAIKKATELANILSGLGGIAMLANLDIIEDPGKLTIEQGQKIMKDIKDSYE
jgi:hypothetical protein